jgi:hypothetical protein
MDAVASAPGADSRAPRWFLVVFRIAPPALSPATLIAEEFVAASPPDRLAREN